MAGATTDDLIQTTLSIVVELAAQNATETQCAACGATEFVAPLDDLGSLDPEFLTGYLCDECEALES